MAGQHLKFTKIFYYLSDITTSQRYFNLKLVSRHKKKQIDKAPLTPRNTKRDQKSAKSQHSKPAPQKSTHLVNPLPCSTCNSLLLGCLTMKCKCKKLRKRGKHYSWREGFSGVINGFIGNSVPIQEWHPNIGQRD